MTRLLGLLLLFVVAASYMRIALFIPIDWTDEGQIVYAIWRTAEGEIPYRDFLHLYGPSMFFFNGLLFRLFDYDLSVLRYALLALKAATCVMVYVTARRMSGPTFAAIAYAIAVVMSGLVWLVSTTPYASFYGIALCFAGMLCLLRGERRFLLGCAAAGLCFGLAATFKQTTGAFAFLAAALFLLSDEGRFDGEPGKAFRLLIRLCRWFVLLIPATVAAIYLAPSQSVWTFALLFTPIVVLTGHLVMRELQTQTDVAQQLRSFWGTIALTVSFSVPLLAYAVYFGASGLVGDVLHNTITGIPSILRWFTRLPTPTTASLLWFMTIFGSFAAASIWRARSATQLTVQHKLGIAGLTAAALIAVSFLVQNGWQAREADWWLWATEDLLFSLPFLLVWIALFEFVRTHRSEVDQPDLSVQRAFRLMTLFATMTLLWLYPAGDVWHVIALLPCCLPLLAYLLQRFWLLPVPERRGTVAWKFGAGILVASLCMLFTIPAARDVAKESRAKQAFLEPLPRATNVRGESAPYTSARNGGKLVRYLTQEGYEDEGLYVLSAKSLFYFLTDRVSPVQQYEFPLYMIAFNAIPKERVHLLVDESELVRRIDEARPLIVDDLHDDLAGSVRRMFPKLSTFIRENYTTEKEFGNFHVLRRNPDASR